MDRNFFHAMNVSSDYYRVRGFVSTQLCTIKSDVLYQIKYVQKLQKNYYTLYYANLK